MSQPAKQNGTVIAAAPVQDLPLSNPVVTRPQSRTVKRTLNGSEAEAMAMADNAIPAQAVLMSQVTGEPLAAPGTQVAERCPVSEPGVADACGLSGAADVHAAAASPLWALALLPLLGAGGGGGGGPATPFTVTALPQNYVNHSVSKTGDTGQVLVDFDSNRAGSVFHIVKVVDRNGVAFTNKATEDLIAANAATDPDNDPWFYLNTSTGQVSLTAAGAAADHAGDRYILTVQAQSGSSLSESGSLTFTLTDYLLSPNPAPDVLHPIDTLADNGLLLADFGPDLLGSRYRIVSVTDNESGLPVTGKSVSGAVPYGSYTDNTSKPASDAWFYLDTTTGKVYLTKAGAAAACIGESFTVAVEGIASDGSTSDTATVSFTLDAPANAVGHEFSASDITGLKIIDAASSYDVFEVHQGNSGFTEMQFEPTRHGASGATNSLYIQVDQNFAEIENHFQVGAGNRAIEYLTFLDDGTYYGYDLGTKAGLDYYRVSQTESTKASPTLHGTGCNDLLFGSTAPDGHTEFLYGEGGNDLIFADPLFTGSPGNWVPLTNGFVDHIYGGAGNDLLVAGGGNDELEGGTGNDVLIGGFGLDSLTGGAGADKFVFNASKSAADKDTITDFNAADGDQILLDTHIFGADALTSHVTYNNTTGELSYDSTVFAVLSNKPTDISGSVFMV